MRIIGIDYGRKKVGIARSEGFLAEPLKVVRYKDVNTLVSEIEKLVTSAGAEKVVIGVSEGQMEEESKNFGQDLESRLKIPVETFDETLTSKDAQKISLESGIPQKKRRKMEDAYAATLMLQNYIDSEG